MVRAARKAIEPKFIDMADIDDFCNMLIYGDSGVGKTVLAGTAEKVMFISIEKSGTVSAKRRGSTGKVWPIKKWEDLEEAYFWLYENPDHGFKWIIIDSLTQMQQLALRAILDDAVEKNGDRDLDIPAIQDHQKWQNMFKRFVLAFCDLPVNTLFTALSSQVNDEEGEPFLTPDIAGKGYQISQYVCGQMSCYGYMKIARTPKKDASGNTLLTAEGKKIPVEVRRIIWKDTGKVRGKDRYGVLTPYTDDKTLEELTRMIESDPQDQAVPAGQPTKTTATSSRRVSRRRTT